MFLDEVGELGLDEQAMLLKAIEEKEFMPFGSDHTIKSDFQLIAGTNKNLSQQANSGEFRGDLLARIDLWTYQLPSLKDRIEDIEANIDFELNAIQNKKKTLIKFNKSARALYLEFSKSSQATWKNNFRDLNASITRMTILCDGGRINDEITLDKIERLKNKWNAHNSQTNTIDLEDYLSCEAIDNLDYFDQAQLRTIIETCLDSKSMADAGRKLFAVSRLKKTTTNDSHRVKVLLSKFGITSMQLF
ncbi:hypothetical protein TYM08_P3726 [Marinicellulosiphila megalodicopiae]